MSTPKRRWLMKTEPADFSIDDLARVRVEPWTGVRSYQARNYMRDSMQVGDDVFFYHSSCAVPGIYGIGKVASAAYPDPSQFDRKSKYFDEEAEAAEPRWFLVDIGYVRTLASPITLAMIRTRTEALGDDFHLTRKGSRLSVMPVSAAQWKTIMAFES